MSADFVLQFLFWMSNLWIYLINHVCLSCVAKTLMLDIGKQMLESKACWLHCLAHILTDQDQIRCVVEAVWIKNSDFILDRELSDQRKQLQYYW